MTALGIVREQDGNLYSFFKENIFSGQYGNFVRINSDLVTMIKYSKRNLSKLYIVFKTEIHRRT